MLQKKIETNFENQADRFRFVPDPFLRVAHHLTDPKDTRLESRRVRHDLAQFFHHPF